MSLTTLTVAQVLAWRDGRQLPHRPAGGRPVDVDELGAVRPDDAVRLLPAFPVRAHVRSYRSGGGDA